MKTLLEIAIESSITAGHEILKLYATTDFEQKADGSPVTIADTRSNEILIEQLTKTGIPILSEESTGVALPYPERMWIIDPLDGTKDFIKRNGDFSVMVGLLEAGRPTLGVVYAPVHETLYYATLNEGAYIVRQNSEPKKMTVSGREMEELRCIRSINHFTPRMEAVAEKLHATLHPHGSIGIKAGLLSAGEGDFFFSWGNFGEWDVCAPEIIVQEAGGRVTDVYGNALSYGTRDHRLEHGIVFSNSVCHEHILEALRTTPPSVS